MSAVRASSKAGGQDRKTLLVGGGFALLLIGFVVYAYTSFAGNSTPATVAPPVIVNRSGSGVGGTAAVSSAATPSTNSRSQPSGAATGLGVAAGVEAKRMANASASLDPTLDESAMLRTESLVYAGTGRNIFSATYETPPPMIRNVPPPRPSQPAASAPLVPSGPPLPPPINLKFFGTATRSDGRRQAFLLQGDDVYLAAQGDIVARRYKVKSISATSVQIEDLGNNNTQTLQLQTN